MSQLKIKGTVVVPGFVRGTICLYSPDAGQEIPHYLIPEAQIKQEIERLDKGYEIARKILQKTIAVSEKASDQAAVDIFTTHMLLLKDQKIYEKITDFIKDKQVNVEHAISDVFEGFIEHYNTKSGHFKELTHDFYDLRQRLLNEFIKLKGQFSCPLGEREPVIVVSKRLSPQMVLNLPKENVKALITEEGGFTTHGTILARSLNVPVMFGVKVVGNFNCMDQAVIDGFSGEIIVNPNAASITEYIQKEKRLAEKSGLCTIRGKAILRTKDKTRIRLKLNVSSPGELQSLDKRIRHDGIGLLRTEFLFLDKDEPPSEEEQFIHYRVLQKECGNKTMTVRLLDIGSDKMPKYLPSPAQINPDLEIKGARALKLFYDVYLSQAKALLRAAYFGNIRILYPMVADTSDVADFKALLRDAKNILQKERNEFNGKIKDGVMFEVPSAALLADDILKMVHFANIGSNDLLQYTLAASRGMALTEEKYHILHPSILKLFEMIITAGKKQKKEICLCGEAGSFECYYPLFLQMGLRSFSVNIAKYPYLKCELSNIGIPQNKQLYKNVIKAKSKQEQEVILNT